MLRVIEAYLTGRKQFVQASSVKSCSTCRECSFPQGSILGPLLFLVYVLDYPVALASSFYSFADDSKLLSIHLAMMTCKLQHDLKVVGNWCLEVDAMSCFFFQQTSNSHLSLLDNELYESSEEKDLVISFS